MIAFPSQEKGNALYTLHNRIFHLSDSGIESTNLSHFQFIHSYFQTGVSGHILNSFIIFIRPGWSLQNSQFISQFYQTRSLLSSSQIIQHFYQDLEVCQTQFISPFYQTWSPGHKLSLLKSFCNEKESGFRFNSFANNNLINIIR